MERAEPSTKRRMILGMTPLPAKNKKMYVLFRRKNEAKMEALIYKV
jgi:hypothetical protein